MGNIIIFSNFSSANIFKYVKFRSCLRIGVKSESLGDVVNRAAPRELHEDSRVIITIYYFDPYVEHRKKHYTFIRMEDILKELEGWDTTGSFEAQLNLMLENKCTECRYHR